jgi:hypothetical protein
LGEGSSQKYFGYGLGPKKHFGPGPVQKKFWCWSYLKSFGPGPGPGQKKNSGPGPGQKKNFGPGTTLLISKEHSIFMKFLSYLLVK